MVKENNNIMLEIQIVKGFTNANKLLFANVYNIHIHGAYFPLFLSFCKHFYNLN